MATVVLACTAALADQPGDQAKDQAEVLVHFGKGQTQQWMLVRLPDPQTEVAGKDGK